MYYNDKKFNVELHYIVQQTPIKNSIALFIAVLFIAGIFEASLFTASF